jgi:hypothetical protein
MQTDPAWQALRRYLITGVPMKRFIKGEDRGQGTLLPEHLDDYVAEDNPVRVIEVFVGDLDLAVSASRVSIQQRQANRPTIRLCSSNSIFMAT